MSKIFDQYLNNFRQEESKDHYDRHQKESHYDRDREHDRDRQHDRQHDKDSKTQSDDEDESYTINNLIVYLEENNMYVTHQFVTENTISFIKIMIEKTGESILIYFPSKYNIYPDKTYPISELIPYELSEDDYLNLYKTDELDIKTNQEDTNEADNYDSFDLNEGKKENKIRKNIIRYNNQLEKFKNCFGKLKYKITIYNNEVFCSINRHNEIDCYILKNEVPLVKNYVDKKKEIIYPIEQEFYFMIDLNNFYDKINDLPDDISEIYKNFYRILTSAHTKYTLSTEQKLKNYNQLISKIVNTYNTKHQFLQLINNLSDSLNKANDQEDIIVKKLEQIQSKESINALQSKTQNGIKLSKTEKDLNNIKIIKRNIIKNLQELKTKFNSFIITFDHVISTVSKRLKLVDSEFNLIGIKMQSDQNINESNKSLYKSIKK